MFLETVCRSICPAVCLNPPSLDALRVRPWAYKSFDLGGGTVSSRIGHKFRLNGCQRRTVLRYFRPSASLFLWAIDASFSKLFRPFEEAPLAPGLIIGVGCGKSRPSSTFWMIPILIGVFRCLMASCNVTGRRSLDTAMDQSKRSDQDTMQLRNTVTNDTAHTVPQGVVDKIRSLTNG